MAGANVASVLQRLGGSDQRSAVEAAAAVVPASALEERLDVPGGRPLFPVAAPLLPLLPGGGLRPGTVVAVRGSMALLLALLATATADRAWAAVLGVPDLGVLAASEAGVAVHRLALVPAPGPELSPVAAALLDGMGLVALSGAEQLPAGARRSLAARARQRGSILLSLGRWPGADVELDCRTEAWHGADAGHGRLRSREVLVQRTGRGTAARPRTVRLLLPGPGGPVATATAGSGAAEIRAVS